MAESFDGDQPLLVKRSGQLAAMAVRQLLGLALVLVAAWAPLRSHAQQLSLYTAVDLALRNSTAVRMSTADVQRAAAGVSETVDVYKPSFLFGSSLGYSYGFPVGQPSVYSISAQSLIFSFSQPDYVRSARQALKAAELQLKDTRQQVILDTATDYLQLDNATRAIAALDQESAYVDRLITIEDERVAAGLDSKVDLTRQRLIAAQVRLRRLHLLGQADALRARLAHLTSLSVSDIRTAPESIPPAPQLSASGELSPSAAAENSGVKAAYASARSKQYAAFGDSRQNYRPIFAFGGAYNRYAKFNNYNEYYLRFQHNNFDIGVQITVPLFDASRAAKAQGSRADAARAFASADQVRDQVNEQTLELRGSLAELAAAQQVAELQNELAQDQLDAILTQMQSGVANPNAAPLTPKEEQQARIEERSRYIDLLDSRLQLMQAQLSLLRTLGAIEDWAKSVPRQTP